MDFFLHLLTPFFCIKANTDMTSKSKLSEICTLLKAPEHYANKLLLDQLVDICHKLKF